MGKTYSLIMLLGCLLLSFSVTAHPSHDSFTEIDWNLNGSQLEVSMRIIPEALESALATQNQEGQLVPLENTSVSKPLVEAYLQRHFEVRNTRSELMPLSLVGMTIEYAESWLYFTVDATVKDSLSLRHTVLMAHESQQVNRVQRLWKTADAIQLYTQDKPERQLWQAE